jgi:hypothetical protein
MRPSNKGVVTNKPRHSWWPIYLVLTMNVAVVLVWMLMQGDVPASLDSNATEALSIP